MYFRSYSLCLLLSFLSGFLQAQPITDNTVYQWEVNTGTTFGRSNSTALQRVAVEPNGTLWSLGERHQGNIVTLIRVSGGTYQTFRSGQNGMPTINPVAIAAHNGTLWALVGNGSAQPLKLYKFADNAWTSVDIAPSLFPVGYQYHLAQGMSLKADPSGGVWLFFDRNRILKLNANGSGTAYEVTLPTGDPWGLFATEFAPTGELHLLYERGSSSTQEVLLMRQGANGQFTPISVRTEVTFNSKRDPTTMTIGSNNALWIGFGTGGASRYQNNQWFHYTDGTFLVGQDVRGITVDKQNTTWFSTDKIGLWKLPATGLATEVYNPKAAAGMMWTGATNEKWILSGTGPLTRLTENPTTPVLSFSHTSGSTTRPTTFTTLSIPTTTDRNWYMGERYLLNRDQPSNQPLTDVNGNLTGANLSNNRTVQYQYLKPGTYRVLLVTEDQNNRTETHLARPITISDTRNPTLQTGWQTLDSLGRRYVDEAIVSEMLSLDPTTGRIATIFRSGVVGFGQQASVNGAIWLNGNRWEEIVGITEYNRTAPANQQLSAVRKVVVSPKDGAVWLLEKGRSGNLGAAVFRVLAGKVTRYPVMDVNGIVTANVYDLAVGPDGTAWLIGLNDNVTGSDNGDNNMARFDGTRWQSFKLSAGGNSSVIAVDANNVVWFSDGFELFGYDGKTVFSRTQTNLPGTYGKLLLAIDSKGRKWLAHDSQSRLLRVEGTTVTPVSLPTLTEPNPWMEDLFPGSGTITSLVTDKNDLVWVGTTRGLASLTGTTWKIYQTTTSGLPANNITSLGVTAQNGIWVGSSNHNTEYNNGYGFLSLFANTTITTPPTTASLAFSPASGSVSAVAGVYSVSMLSNASWSLVSDSPWLTATPTSGSGNATLRLQVDANPAITERTAKLTATAPNGLKAELTVLQRATAPPSSTTTTPPSSTTTTTITNGLVAHYPFNGNARDESGNGNHGIVYGPELTTDRFGQANRAYEFDGLDEDIEVPDNDRLDLTGDFSFSVWILTTGSASVQSVLSKHMAGVNNAGTYSYGIWRSGNNNKLDFQATPFFDGQVQSNVAIVSSQWTHVAFTYNRSSGVWKQYINGTVDRTGNRTFTIANTKLELLIGSMYHQTQYKAWYFKGKIDDIFMYNRALSDAEVQYLYSQNPQVVANVLTASPTSLVAATTGSTLSAQLTSNTNWTVGSNSLWLTATPTSGSGNAALSIIVAANPTFIARIGKLTVTGPDGLQTELTVTQPAAVATASMVVSIPTTIPAEGGTYSISITANTTWTLTPQASWLTLNASSGNAGTSTVTLTAAPHANTTTNRTGTLQLTPANGGGVSTLSLTQAKLVVLGLDDETGLLKVYPNPASRIVDVEFSYPVVFPVWVLIVDMQGRLMQQTEVVQRTSRIQVSVSRLPVGQYLIQVKSGEGKIQVGKLIRE